MMGVYSPSGLWLGNFWTEEFSGPRPYMLIDLFNCFLSPCKLLFSAVFRGNECCTWTVCCLKNQFFFALNLPPVNFFWWLLVLYHEKQSHSLFVFSKPLMIPYTLVIVALQLCFSRLKNPTLCNLSPRTCLALKLSSWPFRLLNICSWDGIGSREYNKPFKMKVHHQFTMPYSSFLFFTLFFSCCFFQLW